MRGRGGRGSSHAPPIAVTTAVNNIQHRELQARPRVQSPDPPYRVALLGRWGASGREAP